MRFKIQLSGIKDIDLLALFYNRRFRFADEVKASLIAYVSKKGYIVFLPEPDTEISISLAPVQINIPLDDKEDKETIVFLKSIKHGCRSAAIKSIFRNMLQEPVIYAFLATGNKVIPEPQKTVHEAPQEDISKASTQLKTNGETALEEAEDEFDIFSGDFITNY